MCYLVILWQTAFCTVIYPSMRWSNKHTHNLITNNDLWMCNQCCCSLDVLDYNKYDPVMSWEQVTQDLWPQLRHLKWPGMTGLRGHRTSALSPSTITCGRAKVFTLTVRDGMGDGWSLLATTHQQARKAARLDCDETCRCCWQRTLASRTPLLQSFAWLRRLCQGRGQSWASSTCSFLSSSSPPHSLRSTIRVNGVVVISRTF